MSYERYSEDLDDLDASVFSGEMLETNLEEFEYYVDRWKRAIDNHKSHQKDD